MSFRPETSKRQFKSLLLNQTRDSPYLNPPLAAYNTSLSAHPLHFLALTPSKPSLLLHQIHGKEASLLEIYNFLSNANSTVTPLLKSGKNA